jgi:hypothetical protein
MPPLGTAANVHVKKEFCCPLPKPIFTRRAPMADTVVSHESSHFEAGNSMSVYTTQPKYALRLRTLLAPRAGPSARKLKKITHYS